MIVAPPGDVFDAVVLGVLALVTLGILAVFAFQERARCARKTRR